MTSKVQLATRDAPFGALIRLNNGPLNAPNEPLSLQVRIVRMLDSVLTVIGEEIT